MSAATWTQLNGDVLVVYFSEAKILDDARIQQVGKELLEVVKRAEKLKMVINFQNVAFMSSAMIGKLIQMRTKCKEEKVELKCSNVNAKIMEVFKITNLTKLFEFYDDEAVAVKAFEKKGWFS
jgi:anti-sigma B factor antagonist